MITHVCAEFKLRIHPNLTQSNFWFTYSRPVCIYAYIVDLWTLNITSSKIPTKYKNLKALNPSKIWKYKIWKGSWISDLLIYLRSVYTYAYIVDIWSFSIASTKTSTKHKKSWLQNNKIFCLLNSGFSRKLRRWFENFKLLMI